jgi:hypothetical protein
MRKYPDALHAGLETITQTTLRFWKRQSNSVSMAFSSPFNMPSMALNTRQEYEELWQSV